MYLLDRLWRGEISPTERFVRPNSEYKKTSKQFSDEIDAFVSTLSPDAKRQMEVVDRLLTDLAMMTEEDVFIYGFRMGARMILDVVGDYKGQFYDAGEVGQ